MTMKKATDATSAMKEEAVTLDADASRLLQELSKYWECSVAETILRSVRTAAQVTLDLGPVLEALYDLQTRLDRMGVAGFLPSDGDE